MRTMRINRETSIIQEKQTAQKKNSCRFGRKQHKRNNYVVSEGNNIEEKLMRFPGRNITEEKFMRFPGRNSIEEKFMRFSEKKQHRRKVHAIFRRKQQKDASMRSP